MATGNTLCVFTPHHGDPPASNYATLDTRNTHPVLEFDKDTIETIYFEGVLPRNYNSGGVTARIAWMADGATANACVWGVSFERHQDGVDDLDADSFASEKTVAATTAGTDGAVDYADIAFTNGAEMDSVAAGEHFRLRVRRVATDGSDTLAVDAQLLSVELRET